jgi:hypothetical protein
LHFLLAYIIWTNNAYFICTYDVCTNDITTLHRVLRDLWIRRFFSHVLFPTVKTDTFSISKSVKQYHIQERTEDKNFSRTSLREKCNANENTTTLLSLPEKLLCIILLYFYSLEIRSVKTSMGWKCNVIGVEMCGWTKCIVFCSMRVCNIFLYYDDFDRQKPMLMIWYMYLHVCNTDQKTL